VRAICSAWCRRATIASVELEVAGSEVAQIVAWVRAALPFEACGLLVGRAHADGRVTVVRAVLARNATDEPAQDRYEVHPEDFLASDRAARADGLDIVGVWHSHPDSAARPSRTDLERAWPGWSYLIVGRAAHADLHVRSWRVDEDGAAHEERLCEPLTESRTEARVAGRDHFGRPSVTIAS
jgi:proteasome lid subunit RPN8/RPN11